MHQEYPDIIALTDRAPDWFDDNGVPRYAPFHPALAPNIYADEVVLLLVACQMCGAPFKVCMSRKVARMPRETFADMIKKKTIGAHDPPNAGHHKDCCGGASMTSVPIQVQEYWMRSSWHRREWVRDAAYEIAILPDDYGDWPIRKDLMKE